MNDNNNEIEQVNQEESESLEYLKDNAHNNYEA